MGKTLASLAIMASLVGGSVSRTSALEAGSRIENTKRAISDLIATLPANYGAAREVLSGDLKLLEDGDISIQDEAIILSHINKLGQIARESVVKVQSALVKPPENKGKPPINEAESAKAERELQEKTLADANKFFNEPKNFIIADTSTAGVETKEIGGNRIFILKKNGGKKKPTDGETPTASITVSYGGNKRLYRLKPGQTYNYAVNEPGPMAKGAKRLEKVRLIFFKDNWERIDLDGNKSNGFGLEIESGKNINIIIPPGCSIVQEKFDMTLEPVNGKIPTEERYEIGRSKFTLVQLPGLVKE